MNNYLLVDLFSDFTLDLTSVSREESQEALLPTVDYINLMQRHCVHYFLKIGIVLVETERGLISDTLIVWTRADWYSPEMHTLILAKTFKPLKSLQPIKSFDFGTRTFLFCSSPSGHCTNLV